MRKRQFISSSTVIRGNDRWLCDSPTEVSTLHSNFPTTAMLVGVVNNEANVVPTHFFPKVLRFNATVCIETLDTIVKSWIQEIAQGRLYVNQHGSVPPPNLAQCALFFFSSNEKNMHTQPTKSTNGWLNIFTTVLPLSFGLLALLI